MYIVLIVFRRVNKATNIELHYVPCVLFQILVEGMDFPMPQSGCTYYSSELFHCEECGKAFASHSGLRSHKMRHDGRYRYTCDICGKGFIQISHFDGHMNNHRNARPYKCPKCGKGFAEKCNMARHVRIVHGSTMCTCTVSRTDDGNTPLSITVNVNTSHFSMLSGKQISVSQRLQ